MNKIVKFAVPVVALLSLTACASSTPAPQPQPTIDQGQSLQQGLPDEVPYDPPALSNEDIFYAYISDNFPGTSRSAALNLGNAICSALGEGTSLLEIGNIGVNSGFTPEQAGQIVGASIGALCPEYKYLVDQLS